MKKRLVLFVFTLSLPLRLLAQDSGVFLTLPVSAKAGAMGDSYTAISDDPFGIYYNPAGIAFARNFAVALTYHKYLQDVTGNSFGLVYPFKNFSFAVAPTIFKMKDEPIYDSQGVATGESFGYEGKVIPIAVALRLGRLAVGGAVKSYKENIGGGTSGTTAYDLGALYRLNRFSVGASLQNIGGKVFDYELAKITRLGVAYNLGKHVLAVDFKKEGEDSGAFSVGTAFALSDSIKLRGGWRFRDDFGGLTFGLGTELGSLSFDYAFLSYGDLGVTHKAGLSLAFPPGDGKPKPKRTKPVQPVAPVAVNNPPSIDWSGEEGYFAGISTGVGSTEMAFVYRIRYSDLDGHSPAQGFPRVHIAKSNWEIPGSPFEMEFISGNNKVGAIYTYSQTLTPGNDYSYFFEARDTQGASATGIPTTTMPGPSVVKLEMKRISGGTNVAVAEFTGKNVSQADASIVTDFVRTELIKTGLFNVMDRNNMDTVLAEQKFQNSGCTEQECAAEMGKLLNVKQMLVGSLSKLVDTYYITLNVTDVETGKIVASYESEAYSSRELKEACRKLVKNILH